ncbi:MAG: CRISPR-associated endonuclease Cas2 [Candidatus Nealsonbacteria bacterium CG08_land_8_20_14_0_20_43_11]|uniref:CRISPR-associated endonuclease Cas2 n=1 Tax=Candidatus Nealsonbacteria bacterium CG08_land_8_20_14_0_20_43_11 TaxID=1974706 RepID=A0A2M6T152_9BACT|nr:MAG: CRISPR-associated endonuclease Cas2 [Candidatus Nealsonbacteria bacterium CG08_land_8_20_14_0_20_43_11]
MDDLTKKILILLMTGVSLGFTYSPNRQFKVLKAAAREWKKINEESLKKQIRALYHSRLIKVKQNSDGSLTYVLTDKGKAKVLTYYFQTMKVKKGSWDGKWRIVVFDIPEKRKVERNAFRNKIKELGFYELQKSVFVLPYPCGDELNFIIEFFNLRKYVRLGLLENIDNELHLKKIFHLL